MGVTTDSIKLTKSQKKEAKEAKKAEEKRLDTQKKAEAEQLALKLSGNSDETKAGKVRGEVKDELKELYKAGEIDKETYKEAKEYSGKGNIFGRFFGKKKDSTIAFEAKATENNIEKTQEEGPKFGKKLTKKLEQAHITNEDIYAIGERNVGEDNKVSYSWKKRQPGEADAIKADLNGNTGGVEFSKKEAKKIMKEAGYDVEHTLNGGKIAKAALLGGAVGAPLEFVKMTQHTVVQGAVGVTVDNMMKLTGASAVTAAVGAGIEIGREITRVEKKVAETDLPTGVKTYDEYTKYMNADSGYATKKGAPLMGKIAKFYVGDDGQTLDKTKMETDLKKAAGQGSVLNYEEAVALHSNLVNDKNNTVSGSTSPMPTKPVSEVVEPEIKTCKIKLTDETKEVVKELPTKDYPVKSGDNWYAVVMGKYAPQNPADAKAILRYIKDAAFEEMKNAGTLPKGVTSSKDGFFPKVGDKLVLPEEIEVNGKKYNYNENGKVKSGALGGQTKVANAASNPFKKASEETTYGYDSCNGKVSGLTKEARDAELAKLKQENPNVEYVEIN